MIKELLINSLNEYPNWQKNVKFVDIDGMPISISTPCFEGGDIYTCIGANMQAIPVDIEDYIENFAEKADEIARDLGILYYVSSGQDYRVYTNVKSYLLYRELND